MLVLGFTFKYFQIHKKIENWSSSGWTSQVFPRQEKIESWKFCLQYTSNILPIFPCFHIFFDCEDSLSGTVYVTERGNKCSCLYKNSVRVSGLKKLFPSLNEGKNYKVFHDLHHFQNLPAVFGTNQACSLLLRFARFFHNIQ